VRLIVWGIFFLLAILWTGSAVVLAQAIEWSVLNLSAGSSAMLEAATGNIVIPMWLSPLLAPSVWATLLQTVQTSLAELSGFAPLVGTLMAWLAPLVWVIWGLGLLLLIGLAVAANALVGRGRRS
jgi:hypothetical protein